MFDLQQSEERNAASLTPAGAQSGESATKSTAYDGVWDL